jgi:hypothetical protein
LGTVVPVLGTFSVHVIAVRESCFNKRMQDFFFDGVASNHFHILSGDRNGVLQPIPLLWVSKGEILYTVAYYSKRVEVIGIYVVGNIHIMGSDPFQVPVLEPFAKPEMAKHFF